MKKIKMILVSLSLFGVALQAQAAVPVSRPISGPGLFCFCASKCTSYVNGAWITDSACVKNCKSSGAYPC